MTIFKIKPNKEKEIIAWGARVMRDFRDEAVAAMKEENITLERMVIFQIGNEWYMTGNSEFSRPGPKPANADREINKMHKAMLDECIEERISVQKIYDIRI